MGGFTSGMYNQFAGGSSGQPNYQPTQGTGQNPSVSIGFGMEPQEFQEGLSQDQQNTIGNQTNMFTQSMQQPTYQTMANTVFGTPQQQPPGGLFSNMFGTVLGGVGQAFQNAASQPGNSTQQQQAVNAVGNTFGNVGSGFGGGKKLSGSAPMNYIDQNGKMVYGGVQSAPGGIGDLWSQYKNNLPAPGQNPSVSIGMPAQQPAFRPDTRGPGGFGNDYNGNPLGANGLPLQMTMATSRPAQAGAPMQQPANRFIPPNAPGAGARRPVAGVQLPGQTGMARPRTAPQPAPMNRFRNRFI